MTIPIQESDECVVAGEHIKQKLCFDVLVESGGLLWWEGLVHLIGLG